MKKHKQNHKSKKPPSFLLLLLSHILNFFQRMFPVGVNNKQKMFVQTVITMSEQPPSFALTYIQLLNNYILNKMNCFMLNKEPAGVFVNFESNMLLKASNKSEKLIKSNAGIWLCFIHSCSYFLKFLGSDAVLYWYFPWNINLQGPSYSELSSIVLQ